MLLREATKYFMVSVDVGLLPKFPCALDITALTGSAGIVALHQYPVIVSCYRHKYVLGWGTMTKNISRSWHRSC